MYPTVLVTVRTIPTQQTVKLEIRKLKREMTAKIVQTTLMRYWKNQKTLASFLLASFLVMDAKIHSSLPLSLILLHHLSPTKILNKTLRSHNFKITYLPVTFLTVQKSTAFKEMTMMYISTVLSLKSPKNM